MLVEEVLKEDLSDIKKRVKEHIIARGKYNPISPLSLNEWRQIKERKSWEVWRNIYGNQELFNALLLEMNEEDCHFIYHTFKICEKVEEFFSGESGVTEEDWKKSGFVLEDILKTLEAAQAKVEAKKNKKRFTEQTPYP